jgi:peptide/nickel transport system substrate-binding protein
VEPPFNRVVWRVIENDSARLTTFRNGDIDAYGAAPGISAPAG